MRRLRRVALDRNADVVGFNSRHLIPFVIH
jgi:hypothetical protein